MSENIGSSPSNPKGDNNNKDDIITAHKPGNEKISENKYTKDEIKEKRMNRMVRNLQLKKYLFFILLGCFFHSRHTGLYCP